MNTAERWNSQHYRTCLISKFNYTKAKLISRIRGCKILALVPPSHYEVLSSIMFVGTGIWPASKLFAKKKKKRGGKYFLLMLMVHISKLWSIFGNSFMWRSAELHYPCMDASDPGADYVFVMRNLFRNSSIYFAPYLVEGFFEFIHMMGYNARLIKALSQSWRIKWIMTTTDILSLSEHAAALRGYAFGATDNIPFVSVFSKHTTEGVQPVTC